MNIVFVENRYKTDFWKAVAQEMRALDRHNIYWIVQNRLYSPKSTGKVYFLGYPPAISDSDPPEGNEAEIFDTVAATDRNVKYFGGSTSHYKYYWQAINDVPVRNRAGFSNWRGHSVPRDLDFYQRRAKGDPLLLPYNTRISRQ